MIGFFVRSLIGSSHLQRALRAHFKRITLTDIVTVAREFPITSRVDVQTASKTWSQSVAAQSSCASIRR